MKYILQFLLGSVIILYVGVGCNKEDDVVQPAVYDVSKSYSLKDVEYGKDAAQRMDVYLPANRSSDKTKVFVMIHGGGWSAGDKADYTATMDAFKNYFPGHAIININYRLGTQQSPGYPKQIQDIQSVLDEIKKQKYNVSEQYLLFGGSAGVYLLLLYAYAFGPDHHVRGVVNTVGPVDLTDTLLTGNVVLMGVVGGLLGKAIYDYKSNEVLFAEASPAKRVTATSPPTISFYGDKDPLIPVTQMPLLRKALEEKAVWHYDTIYPGGGHGLWASEAQNQDYINRTIGFINQFFK